MRLAWIHVLMHADVLPKVWDQIRGGWDIHTGPHRDACVSTQLCEGHLSDSR